MTVPGIRLGDLTPDEIAQIQEVVEDAGRPLEVVGSAARGVRKGVGLKVAPCKGKKSDIDYAIAPSCMTYFRAVDAEKRLPDVDVRDGLLVSLHSAYDGPSVKFSPGEPPRFIPQKHS